MKKLIIFGDSHFVMSTSFYFLQEIKPLMSHFELFAVSGSTWLDWKLNAIKNHNINWQYKNEKTQQTQMGVCPWFGFSSLSEFTNEIFVFEFGSNEMLLLQTLDKSQRNNYIERYYIELKDWIELHKQNQVIWILPIQIIDQIVSREVQTEFRNFIFSFAHQNQQFNVIDSWLCVDDCQNAITANHDDRVHVIRPRSNLWGKFIAESIKKIL